MCCIEYFLRLLYLPRDVTAAKGSAASTLQYHSNTTSPRFMISSPNALKLDGKNVGGSMDRLFVACRVEGVGWSSRPPCVLPCYNRIYSWTVLFSHRFPQKIHRERISADCLPYFHFALSHGMLPGVGVGGVGGRNQGISPVGYKNEMGRASPPY